MKTNKIKLDKQEKIVYGICVRCGGRLTSDHICKDIIEEASENIRMEIDNDILDDVILSTRSNVNVKNSFLPDILLELKVFKKIGIAIDFINSGRVKVNDVIVTDFQYTNNMKEFKLEVDSHVFYVKR